MPTKRARKLAYRSDAVKNDFQKLIKFKREPKYQHLIEVVIGENHSLERIDRIIDSLYNPKGEEITLIEFNTKSLKAQRALRTASNERKPKERAGIT